MSGDILLRVGDAGHAGATGDQYFDDVADEYTFLLEKIGVAAMHADRAVFVAIFITMVSVTSFMVDILL